MNPDIPNSGKETVDVARLAGRSWEAFTQKPLEHLMASLIVIVLSAVSFGILLGPLSVGHIRMVEKQQRGENIIIQDVFSGFSSFWSALFVTILYFLCVAIGTAILVVPGLFILAAWGFAYCFIARNDAGPSAALSGSWKLLKTQTASVLLVVVLLSLFGAVGGAFVITTLITAPLSTIFYTLAFGELLERAEPGSLD